MEYQVVLTEQAIHDLVEIYSYILNNLQSKPSADNTLNRLNLAMKGLSVMPKRYRRYAKEPWYNRGLRFLPVGNYSVLYLVDDSKSVVSIIHVVYGKRDLDKVLAD